MTITVSSAEIAAQAASLGFDFLWIEREHSPITLETLRNMVLATRRLKALPFVRVPVELLGASHFYKTRRQQDSTLACGGHMAEVGVKGIPDGASVVTPGLFCCHVAAEIHF